MPGPTGTEIAVSTYWSQNYQPFDVVNTGTIHITQNGYIAETWDVVTMNDGTWWFDTDRDGWFDFGENLNGDRFDGYEWRRVPEPDPPADEIELDKNSATNSWNDSPPLADAHAFDFSQDYFL